MEDDTMLDIWTIDCVAELIEAHLKAARDPDYPIKDKSATLALHLASLFGREKMSPEAARAHLITQARELIADPELEKVEEFAPGLTDVIRRTAARPL